MTQEQPLSQKVIRKWIYESYGNLKIIIEKRTFYFSF